MDTWNRDRVIRIATEITCYLEIPLQQEAVDGSVEIPNVLGKRAAMALLPAVDGPGFAAVSPVDPHVSHARGVLEDLDHTEGQILVERILGDNVHEE
ncbi:penicillin-binding protein [Lasius niger]|uniref:Penicillin-binding protein n=1 Tax=Lasius niger TaxID=67767 RepID=A0A0J7KX51_LASNI|nr:penicillin-binding protein [Lasius niger]